MTHNIYSGVMTQQSYSADGVMNSLVSSQCFHAIPYTLSYTLSYALSNTLSYTLSYTLTIPVLL